MRDWKDLESAFRELAQSLRDSRIDVQWGAAGTHCRLASWVPAHDRHRFESLASIAGKKLRSHAVAQSVEELLVAPSDFDAWALGLKNLSRTFRFGMIAEQTSVSGESGGFIYTGSIDAPADASANLCLVLEVEADDALGRRLFELTQASGASAHLEKAYRAAKFDPPDWAVVAREAVSALEAVARVVCRNSSATLGDCLSQIRKENRLHPSLTKSLDAVWGFTNQSPGIRHGSHELPSITPAEARFVLLSSEAGIELLLAAS